MRPAMRALSFMLPGKARAFPVAELAAAKERLSEKRHLDATSRGAFATTENAGLLICLDDPWDPGNPCDLGSRGEHEVNG